jgi:uncharacterized protein YukE
MHREHRLWESDINFWRDDLRAWQQELAKAQSQVKQLEKALEDHAHALRQHGAAIRLQEQTFGEHEHALAEYEKGTEGDELFELARQHHIETSQHAQHRTDHESLKRRHHGVITHWNALLKALCETAEYPAPAANKLVVPPS